MYYPNHPIRDIGYASTQPKSEEEGRTQTEIVLENCFVIANNSKSLGNYDLGNMMFAYIFRRPEFRKYLHFEMEVNEPPRFFTKGESSEYETTQYYNLLVMWYKEHYLCLPLTMATISVNNEFLGMEPVLVWKRPHNRVIYETDSLEGFRVIGLHNIHEFITDFKEHEGFFVKPFGYTNPNGVPMRANKRMRRIHPISHFKKKVIMNTREMIKEYISLKKKLEKLGDDICSNVEQGYYFVDGVLFLYDGFSFSEVTIDSPFNGHYIIDGRPYLAEDGVFSEIVTVDL